MLNVIIAGVGGQGSVLAAKILAQAAMTKGWQVRTAETIGMAQRGGSVTSHVRMGNAGEAVRAPLVPLGQAHCIIALEPGEGVRALSYLAPDGLVVSAQSGIDSVVANLAGAPYDPAAMVVELARRAPYFRAVDDAAICKQAGSTKALNVGLLAAAVAESHRQGCGMGDAITTNDIEVALASCVKPRFLDMNRAAMRAAMQAAIV